MFDQKEIKVNETTKYIFVCMRLRREGEMG